MVHGLENIGGVNQKNVLSLEVKKIKTSQNNSNSKSVTWLL